MVYGNFGILARFTLDRFVKLISRCKHYCLVTSFWVWRYLGWRHTSVILCFIRKLANVREFHGSEMMNKPILWVLSCVTLCIVFATCFVNTQRFWCETSIAARKTDFWRGVATCLHSCHDFDILVICHSFAFLSLKSFCSINKFI